MKIIILCTQLEGGGAQRASFRLSQEFRRRNIDAENWFFYKKRDNFSGSGYTTIFRDSPIRNFFDYIAIFWKYSVALYRVKPDAIIAFTHYSNVFGLFFAWLLGVKVRVASHRNPSWGDMSKGLMRIDNLMATYGVYTSITAVSESTKQSFDYYPKEVFESILVIKNGILFTTTILDKLTARYKFGIPSYAKVIGTIGRLTAQKNHQLLIQALLNLDDIYMYIVGEGELHTELQELILKNNLQNRAFLLGEISSEEIPVFLKALDIFVMPSLYEGLSNALVEAMYVGLPIITSDVPSQIDVITDENGSRYGIALSNDSYLNWASTINQVFNEKSTLEHYRNLSLLRAKEFTVEKMTDGFIKSLNVII